ncbi:MAG: manganese efflux pump [Halobacteriota archaeon]|nr:manganese efflux pump [Halobacteriota archaeon]
MSSIIPISWLSDNAFHLVSALFLIIGIRSLWVSPSSGLGDRYTLDSSYAVLDLMALGTAIDSLLVGLAVIAVGIPILPAYLIVGLVTAALATLAYLNRTVLFERKYGYYSQIGKNPPRGKGLNEAN